MSGRANEDFGRAVTEAIHWLGFTTITASRDLGIKPATMNAMTSGIVPMRSLVIRFASEVGRRADARGGAPAWWNDIDAWLSVAGYPPRRDIAPQGTGGGMGVAGRGSRYDGPDGVGSGPAPTGASRDSRIALQQPRRTRSEDPALQEPACHHYRPIYERMRWGDTHFHIFWLVDRDQKKTHQFRFPAEVDYQKRADRLKQDLTTLTKVTFERRYARYRLDTEP